MELRRAADVLLRSQASPLATAINPRSTVRWTTKTQSTYACCLNRSAQRSLTTTTRNNAVRQIPTKTTTRPPPQPAGAHPPKNPMEALGSLWTSGKKPPKPAFPSLTPQQEKRLNGGNSASDLLSSLRARQNERSGLAPSSGTRGTRMDTSKMLDPSPNPFSSIESGSFMSSALKDITIPKTKRVPMKLGPSTGRSVTIGATIDVGRGFRLLEQACARNKVRSDANKQRFHERGGLKRKRLRRERWRRRFMDGFKATVGRVKQLKNQGW